MTLWISEISRKENQTMFSIGDRVQHKQNGKVGKVIGYGFEMVDGYYLTTLEVQVGDRVGIKSAIEDLFNKWSLCQETGDRIGSNLLLNTTV
jgi:hypothetical protein